MLTLVEEVLLLTLDDKSGVFVQVPEYSLELATSGALLMDLALRDRIDADLEALTVLDETPTGEPVLDPVLRVLAADAGEHTLREWILQLARVRFIRERALERLVERGVLRQMDKKFLWVFESRRYPVIDDKEEQEAKLRMLELILGDEIPDPGDVALICVAHASAILPSILSGEDLHQASRRIQEIVNLDLIGRQMLVELRELLAFVNAVGWWGVREATDLEKRIRSAVG